MKKGFGKFGIFCLALVVGLALCGVGYAHWSDTVSIEGTVTTGEWHCGCSHGYWKNHQDKWGPTGYDPTDDFDSTFSDDAFDCDAFHPDITLMDALWLKGGGLNALAREAVAALLNAVHPEVDYALRPEEVIAKVQGTVDSGKYEATKNELEGYDAHSIGGCPLGD